VIEANRHYLSAAVDDPRGTEGSRWALSCLSFNGERLSAVSMKGMETFVVFPPLVDTGEIKWFLNLAKEPLLARYGSLHHFGERFPHLDLDETTEYRDGGADQMRIRGHVQHLAEAFADDAVREGAHALAERLMQSKTSYTRYHSYGLAAAVLGLGSEPGRPYVARDEDAEPLEPAPSGPVDPEKVGAGLRAHNQLQNQLAEAVSAAGLTPLAPDPSGPYFDLAWMAADVFTVIEVKSLTEDNAVRQLRMGLGQVLDYADSFSRSGLNVRAGLYVEHEPNDGRWSELTAAAGVTLAWPGAESHFGMTDSLPDS
jgi:hypothetical protein